MKIRLLEINFIDQNLKKGSAGSANVNKSDQNSIAKKAKYTKQDISNVILPSSRKFVSQTTLQVSKISFKIKDHTRFENFVFLESTSWGDYLLLWK